MSIKGHIFEYFLCKRWVELDSLELVKKIKENLSIKNFPNEIMGVVCENFGTFFIEYTYLDKLHPFNEKLLDIYKLGGFPCGWRGEFPEGKILIYSKNN